MFNSKFTGRGSKIVTVGLVELVAWLRGFIHRVCTANFILRGTGGRNDT